MHDIYRNGLVFHEGRFEAVDFEVVDGKFGRIGGRLGDAFPAAAGPGSGTGGGPGETPAPGPTGERGVTGGAVQTDGAGQTGGAGKAGVRVIDLAGAHVIPGLIDAHAHLTLSTDARRDEPLTSRVLKGARNAAIQLAAGVTAVRDVGGPGRISIELAEAIDAGVLPGPHVEASGSFICATGGHVHYWGREADGEDDARKAVREMKKQGAAFIKIMASGGVADPREDPEASQFTPGEIGTICDEAARLGLYVAAHAHPAAAIRASLEAGVRTIEHASFIDDAGIELALEKGAYLVPTFIVYRVMADAPNLSRQQRDLVARVLDRKSETFLRAAQAGVAWGVGTDAGSFMPQGRLWQEMHLLQGLGLPAEAVIEAATRTNARIIGDESRGRIETGCQADIVVLSADPTADLSVLREPVRVIKSGRPCSTDPFRLPRSETASA